MSWLIVTWFLAFGYVPIQYESVYSPKIELDSEYIATVAQIGLSAQIGKRFTVYGDIETFSYFDKEEWYDGGAFKPYRADYTAGLSFEFNEHLSIIATHECDHVIKMGSKEDGYESSETKIIAKITGK
jgi:hypothetical protein